MKTLYILRHAKSAWPYGVADMDRPLADRGERDAGIVADYLKQNGRCPDFVLCSPSCRTRQTIAPTLDAFPDLNIEYSDEIYHTGTGSLYETVKNLDDGYASVMFVGHNPGLHGLAAFLAGEGDAKDMQRIQYEYKTGTMAVLSFDVDGWVEILPAQGVLETLFVAREHK